MDRKKPTRNLLWSIAVLTILLLAACGAPAPTATPLPRMAAQQLTPTSRPQPAVTAQALAPTSEPQPTAATTAPGQVAQPVGRRLDLPPVVVATSPERGAEQPLDAPIVVRFDQPMEPNSTRAAFAIEPTVPGDVLVQGSQVLFRPSQPLERGQRYRVTIAASARSLSGKQPAAPVEFRFNTVGFLEVTSTQPADGNDEMSVDTPITVIFNRPVVPLTGIEQMKDLPQPLHFDPPVVGQGEWLNTSIYRFQPQEPLAGSTEYRVTVPAGLTDTTGGLLAEDYVFTFRTASPVVVGVSPKGSRVAPTTAITVTFSQPMDPLITQAAFSLRDDRTGELIAGSFLWSEDGRTLRFQPARPLAFNGRYTVQVTDGARARRGDAFLRQPFVARFQTVPRIGVVRTDPADNTVNVAPEDNLRIRFQGVVDRRTLGRQAFTIIPEPTTVYSYYSSYDNYWIINWPLRPRTAYQVTLSKDIADIFGNTLGEDVVIRFTTGDRKPFAYLNLPGDVGTYNAYTNTLITVNYRNISRLDFKLYSVSEAEALRLLGPDRWEVQRAFQPQEDTLIREWSVPVNPPLNASVLTKVALAEDGGPLPPGLYWLEMQAPEISYSANQMSGKAPAPRHLLIVSPLNLIVKKTANEVLVWATDLRNGQPVASLPIRVRGSASADGITDADGVFRAMISPTQPWQPLVIFAGEPAASAKSTSAGQSTPMPLFGAVSSDWQQGLSPWEFDLPAEFTPQHWQAYFYTDRPLYRPGQTVYWKGIIRADDDGQYSVPPPGSRVQVTIHNNDGQQVYEQIHRLNAFGTIHGELPLAEEASLGFYVLNARLLDDGPELPSFSFGFQVAEYRKPEFEVQVTTDRDEYLQGDTINVVVEADFFFGGPVSDARVEWAVFSRDAFFAYRGDGWYSFSDFTGWDSRQAQHYGGLVTSGHGQTDSQGRFTFQIPADLADKLQSQHFTIDVQVTDLNNQVVAASAAVLVHRGLVYPGVAPRRYVGQVGQPSEVDLIAVDWDSQPVANQTLTVVVSKARWRTVRARSDDGRFYWVTQVQETPVLTRTLITDAQGQATLIWTPEEGGQYKINASLIDARGNAVRSSAFMWVSGRPDTYVSWRVENNDRIELVADKRLYQVGDTARVLVPHPYQGKVQALVTVERGGILDVRRVTLTSNSETLEIPIIERYVPNVFVSVVVVKGEDVESSELGSFKLGYVELPIDTTPRELRVTLIPSQEQLRPGETVTFTVQVKDAAGNPVQGEFSLALVDKALLSLTQGEQPTLLDAFYRRRGLGVQTASTLVLNLDRVNQQLRVGAKGGGGGGGEAGIIEVRSKFEDTALWEPALVTDANGQAVVSVKLPDNLTTWRLDSRGITADTRVGQATVDIVTTLPLLVRPVLPRFFVAGDLAEVGAIVNNNTGVERVVRVEMTGEGWEIAKDKWQMANGKSQVADVNWQEVTVPAGGQMKVTWPIEILHPPTDQPVGQLTIRFTSAEQNPPDGNQPLADAVELTLPVYRYTSPETVATAGTVAPDEERLEAIVLPSSVDPTQGELRLRLEPSLAAGMVEGLSWLEHFPYECNEQVVSKFLPNLASYRALRRLGIQRPELEDKLREQIITAVQKLLQRQNLDGGWGWWPGEKSSPFISSYVVFGLTQAQKEGFSVDERAIVRGIAYLRRQLKPADSLSRWQLNQQAFLLYVLAEAGRGDIGRSVALYDVRERLGHYGRALLALTFGTLADQGEESVRPRINTLLDDLTGTAILSATGAHWEEEGIDWWTMNTDTRSTALALAALARLSSSPSQAEDLTGGLAPNVVRWLMATRQHGRWKTTQENAWAIIALTDWMVATGELEADYSYQVNLNGQELASGKVNQDTVDQPIDLRVEVRDLLLDTANGLAISRFAEGSQTGNGQLYYTAHLNYYLPVAELEPLDRGIVVAREYRLLNPVTGETGDSVTSAEVGDTIQVKLTIIAPHNLHYVVVESPLPAGVEAIDTSLATTSQVYEGPQLTRSGQNPWWWIPNHSELRDEKVVLFASYLPAGTYEYTYQIRASLPGRFQILPVTAYEMYFPEVWGRSAGELFRIDSP